MRRDIVNEFMFYKRKNNRRNQFWYHKKNISIAKTILKLRNGSMITIKEYDEMADWMVQNIRKGDVFLTNCDNH